MWLKGRASCGQGKLSRDRREKVRGSQERRGRDLDGLFPAPARRLWRPKLSLREGSVILKGILTSIPEFFTCFLVSMEGLCGWERAEDCSPALDSSKICRALLALLPSSYSIPSAGQSCESLVTSARLQKKKIGKRPANGKTTAPTPRPTSLQSRARLPDWGGLVLCCAGT